MNEDLRHAMLLIASDFELPDHTRVWGHGGWMQPQEREALDWLVLARLSGWSVATTRNSRLDGDLGMGDRWVVVACDPDALREEDLRGLSERLHHEPLMLVSRAGAPGGHMARFTGASPKASIRRGKHLRWTGPGPHRDWSCKQEIELSELEFSPDVSVWATLDGVPIMAARDIGAGIAVTLGFHPSQARDSDGAATALLKHLLIHGALAPVAWFDWDGVMVLRMDDPGGSQNIFSRTWCYPKLLEDQWAAIGEDLHNRDGRLSIAYVSGWADDGDPARGSLTVNGAHPERSPGTIYPSPEVLYEDRAGHSPGTFYDCVSEYAGIQALRAAGRADVELHGYTHIHPDTRAWATAPDRYENISWYRELGTSALATLLHLPSERHPLTLAVNAFQHVFGVGPTTLISPGDQWTDEALEYALDQDLQLVSSYYLAVRHDNRFCWSNHICSPYLDEPDSKWFDAGLPVVGYFHDMDLAVNGVAWMREYLDRWQAEGARRLIDFRELASAVGRCLNLQGKEAGLRLSIVRYAGAPELVRPLPVRIHCSVSRLPSHVSICCGGDDLLLEIGDMNSGFGQVTIPTSLG